MPIDVRMPDGTLVKNVPDNITQADLMARFDAFKAQPITSTPTVDPEIQATPQAPVTQPTKDFQPNRLLAPINAFGQRLSPEEYKKTYDRPMDDKSGTKGLGARELASDVFAAAKQFPEQLASSAIQAYQGKDVETIADQESTANKIVEDARKAAEANMAIKGAEDVYTDFLGAKIKRSDIRNLPQNLSFSLMAMGSALLSGLGTTAVTRNPIAGYGVGAAAAGKVAYNIDTNSFLRDYREGLNQASIEQRGIPITNEEFVKIAQSPEMQAKAKEFNLDVRGKGAVDELATIHGLNEAGWEAISSTVGLGAGKYIFKEAFKGKILKPVAAFTGTLGLELAGETATQLGQSNVERKAGMHEDAERSWSSAEDWKKSYKEVAGPTILTTAILGGAPAAAGAAKRVFTKATQQPDPQERVEPEVTSPEVSETPAPVNMIGADKVLSLAQTRLNEIETKMNGTPDYEGIGFDGKPRTIKGQDSQPITDQERAEYDFLKNNITDPNAIAKTYGLTIDEKAGLPEKETQEIKTSHDTQAMLDELAGKDIEYVPEEEAPAKTEVKPITSVPNSAFNGDLEEGLNRVFLSDAFTGDSILLTNQGFRLDEVKALEDAGLATNGNMNRQQYGRWMEERSARISGKSKFVLAEEATVEVIKKEPTGVITNKQAEPEVLYSAPMGENTEYHVLKNDLGHVANLYDKDAGQYVPDSARIFPVETFGDQTEIAAKNFVAEEQNKAAAYDPSIKEEPTGTITEEDKEFTPVGGRLINKADVDRLGRESAMALQQNLEAQEAEKATTLKREIREEKFRKPITQTLSAKLVEEGGIAKSQKLDMLNETGKIKGYDHVFRETGGDLLVMVKDGLLDDFLPPDIRSTATPPDGLFDARPGYNYISDLINTGEKIYHYDYEMARLQHENTVAEKNLAKQQMTPNEEAQAAAAEIQDKEYLNFEIPTSTITEQELLAQFSAQAQEYISEMPIFESAKETKSFKIEMNKLRRAIKKGLVSEADVIPAIDQIYESTQKDYEPSERIRGAEIIKEKLLAAKRRKELSPEIVDMALFLIDKNPALVKDLAVSITASKRDGRAGGYAPLARLATIFKYTPNNETAVHEILHHLERMMPKDIQAAIRKAWSRSLSTSAARAFGGTNETLKQYYRDVIDYHTNGDEKAQKRAMSLLAANTVGYDHYQNFNPSEFWAINGSSIVQNRYNADISESMVERIKNWLLEFVEKVKALFNLQSDAAVIRALNSVAKGDGKFITDMIHTDSDSFNIQQSKTDTPEFKKWFGNSKVVNPDGTPRVMYHGTTKSFNVFEPSTKANRGLNVEGFYFTSSAQEASEYTSTYLNEITDTVEKNQMIEGANVMPVYLNISNPYNAKSKNYISYSMEKAYEKALTKHMLKTGKADPEYVKSKVEELVDRGRLPFTAMDPKVEQEVIRAGGYDGMHDGPHWVVFDSNQIKSTIGNKGTFNRQSVNILYNIEKPDKSTTDTPAFKKWFGESKVVDENGKPKVMYHGTAGDAFETFDKEKIKTIDYDTPFNGFWFSSDPQTSPAMQDAKNIIPAYLSIKNPAPSEVWRKVAKEVYAELDPSAIRKNARSVDDEIRYRLQDMGYDGIQYNGKPTINKQEFEKNGQTSFKSVSGDWYTIAKNNKTGYVDLYEGKFSEQPDVKKHQLITDYLNLEDYLRSEKEETWLAFEPNQIKSVYNKGAFEKANKNIYANIQRPPRNFRGQEVLPQWHGPEESKIDNWIYNLQNKQIDTKRVQEAIGDIEENWNVYEKEQLYHGRTASGIRNFLLKELLPVIKEIERLKISPEDIRTYLHNRHAEERNIQMNKINPDIYNPKTGRTVPNPLKDKGSGISTTDAQAYLSGLDPARKQILEQIAAKFDQMVQGTQQILINSGNETAETIAKWNKTYKYYVPLFRVEDEMARPSGMGGTGQGFGTRGNFSKRAMGSEKDVQDILSNIIAQRERALIRAEKTRVGRALYGLAIQNPNPDFWLAINPDAIRNKKQAIAELRRMGIPDAEEVVNNLMAEPRERYLKKINVAEGAVEPDEDFDFDSGLPVNESKEVVAAKINVMARYKDYVFPVRINGKDRYIFFNKNDPRALRMVQSLKNLDVENLGLALSIAGKYTRWFKNVNTQYNPVFGLVNFYRDFEGALFNLTSTEIKGQQAKVIAGIFKAMGGIMSVHRAERKGKPLPTGPWAKIYQDARAEGFQTGYRDSLIRNQEEMQIVENTINQFKDGNTKKAFYYVIGALTDFNDMMENAIRLSSYKVALDKGLSKQKAAIIAKNLTVNFDKKGAKTAQANVLYAFFNASVQGTERIYQTIKGPKGKMIIGGGILAGMVQSLMLASAGYDDDDPPEFVREKNFIIPLVDGTYLTLPYPLGYNVLPNSGRIVMDFMLHGGRDPGKHSVALLASVVNSFNPLGSTGLSYQTLAPTIADPLVALAENKDAFGRPISRKDRATAPTPGYTRSRETSTKISQGLAYFLNLASGGSKYQKGYISPTADELDFLAGQIGGGLYREVTKAGKAVSSAFTGEEIPTYQRPVVGRFVGATGSQASVAQSFYNNVTRMTDHENEVKGRMKNQEDVAGYLQDYPEARLWKRANSVENKINELNKRKRLFVERGFPKERIQAIDAQKTLLMQRFNDQVKNLSSD